jgi:hypothetical protein
MLFKSQLSRPLRSFPAMCVSHKVSSKPQTNGRAQGNHVLVVESTRAELECDAEKKPIEVVGVSRRH